MPNPQPLATAFNRMVRDVPRDRLPADACWNLQDYIPNEIDAPLAKRGGWAYASENQTTVLANATQVVMVAQCPFSSGQQLVAVSYDPSGPAFRVSRILSTGSTTDRGTITCGNVPFFYPIFYRDKLYILNSQLPRVYDGASSITTMAGTTPDGDFGCAYKDRLVIARTGTLKQRIYFSAAGDPTTWDTANRYIDGTDEITGLWPLRNQILVFHKSTMERIIGAIPPPGGDMQVQPVFDVGLPRDAGTPTMAGTDQFMCFANLTGAYLTDGSNVVDLTQQGGIKTFWQQRILTATQPLMSAGYFRGWYIVSIRNGTTTPTFVDCFACYLPNRRWIRLTNITANYFSRRVSSLSEELFWGDYSEPRANTFSPIFNPTAATKNDGDLTAILPVVEGGYGPASIGLQQVKGIFVSYDIRDAATDNPTLALSYVESPEATSYAAVSGGDGNAYPLAETTKLERVLRRVEKSNMGVGWKLAQTNASAQTRLYRLDVDTVARQPNRVS